jgi:hypothetical protein
VEVEVSADLRQDVGRSQDTVGSSQMVRTMEEEVGEGSTDMN